MKKLLFAVLLFMFLLADTHVSKAQNDLRKQYGTRSMTAAKYLNKAISLEQGNQSMEAYKQVTSALKADPDFMLAHYWHGHILTSLGRMDESEKAYETVIQLDQRTHQAPTELGMSAHVDKGLLMAKLGQKAKAIEIWSKAVLYDPGDVSKNLWKPYRNMAISHIQSQNPLSAYLSAVIGHEHNPQRVEEKMLEDFSKAANNTHGLDGAQLLTLWRDEVTPKARVIKPDISEVKIEDIEDLITGLYPDPKGAFVMATCRDLNHFYLLLTENDLKVKKIELPEAISAVTHRKGHFYAVLKTSHELIRLTPLSGKIEKIAKLPQSVRSFAIFPDQNAVFYPASGKVIVKFNLLTGQTEQTGRNGESVKSHPYRDVLFAYTQERPRYHSKTIIVNGRPVIIDGQTGQDTYAPIIQYAVSRGHIILSGLRMRAGWNASQIILSPNGKWVGLVAGGGFRPSAGPGGYGVGIFPSHQLDAKAKYFEVGAYPRSGAFNPVTEQLAIGNEKSISIYSLADEKSPHKLSGTFGHRSSWSGNGRYLIISNKKAGVTVWSQKMTDSESQLASTWWRDLNIKPGGIQGGAGAGTLVKREARVHPWLASFKPTSDRAKMIAKLNKAMKEGSTTAPIDWRSYQFSDKDDEIKQKITMIVKSTTAKDKGIRAYRYKKLLEEYPSSLTIQLRLAINLASTGQWAQAKPILTQIIQQDLGRTTLSFEGLRTLARIEKDQNNPIVALQYLSAAYQLDCVHPEVTVSLATMLDDAGFKTKAAEIRNRSKTNQSVKPTSTIKSDVKLPSLPKVPKTKLRLSGAAVYKKAVNSVVLIKRGSQSGAGFCMHSQGFIVTNRHVIEGAGTIQVYCFTMYGRSPRRLPPIEAEVVYADSKMDVAVIKLKKKPSTLRPLLIAEETPTTGTKVFAVGHPGLGSKVLEQSISEGIISSGQRELDNNSYIQHSAAINPGNSGGPLINESGRVVGMVTLKANLENVGFAVPPELIRLLFK